MPTPMVHIEWLLVAPLLVLAGAACLVLLLCALPGRRGGGAALAIALAALGAAFGLTVRRLIDAPSHLSSLGGMLVMDRPALYMTCIVLAAAFLGVLLSHQFLQRAPAPRGEYYALLLLAALGMIIMASTNHLLVMFLGLEVLSVGLYVLAGITRDWLRSLEAAMKYFLLGAFSTGFVLYGMAFLYGATGSLDLVGVGRGVQRLAAGDAGGDAAILLVIGLGLMLVGLGFKVAAVPFHWWAPDVYEGTPTPVTAFMAVGTKGVAFLALARVITVAFGDVLVRHWTVALAALALLSMLLGNLVALTQRNVKRLLAYSSVAHAGYLLVAVAAGSDLGTSALLFYFASYLLTTLGAFGIVSLVAETGPEGDEGLGMLRYAGMGRSHPALALAMSLFMVSLIGVPPTSGFVGKYFIFQSAVQKALDPATGQASIFWLLAGVGILTSVVSAAYYLRVIVTMYMQEPDGAPLAVRTGPGSAVAVALAGGGVLALGLYPAPIYDLTRNLHSALQALAMLLG